MRPFATTGYCDALTAAVKEVRLAQRSRNDALEDMMSDKAILVTGSAGFVGFHVDRQLLAEGRHVVGLDNLNNYYDAAIATEYPA
jgi:UDP-glucuronate 4-epimerase